MRCTYVHDDGLATLGEAAIVGASRAPFLIVPTLCGNRDCACSSRTLKAVPLARLGRPGRAWINAAKGGLMCVVHLARSDRNGGAGMINIISVIPI